MAKSKRNGAKCGSRPPHAPSNRSARSRDGARGRTEHGGIGALTWSGLVSIQRALSECSRSAELSRETHLSAERPGPQATPWVPRQEGDGGRPSDPGEPASQGSQTPVRVIAETVLERLRNRRDFVRVARHRRHQAMPGVIVQAAEWAPAVRERGPVGDMPRLRVGFTVSRKVGGAVVRNRARRRLRAAAERMLARHAACGHDYVLIGRRATPRRPFGELLADLETALKRLHLYKEPRAHGRAD